MAFQILLNALLAFTWMFMNDTYRAADFVSGFALGMIAILCYGDSSRNVLRLCPLCDFQARHHFYQRAASCQFECTQDGVISKA